jgi:hypothetical protein
MIFSITVIITVLLILFYSNAYEKFTGSQFNMITGYFPQGIVTDKINDVSELSGCINTCDKDSNCTGFLMSGQNCWNLKMPLASIPKFIKATNPAVFNPTVGIKQTINCDPILQIFGGKCSTNDYPSNDLLPNPGYITTDNLVNCVQKCEDNIKCVGVSYDTVKKSCYIKNKMTGNGNPKEHKLSWIKN